MKTVKLITCNDAMKAHILQGGSSDIKFRLKKGQRLRAVGAAILSMLAAAPPGDNHWEYTCGQCQRTFEVPVAKFPSSEEKEEE